MKTLIPILFAALLLSQCGSQGSSSELTGNVDGLDWRIELVSGPEGRDPAADLQLANRVLDAQRAELATEGQGSQITQVNSLAGTRSGRLSRDNYDLILRTLTYKKDSRGSVELLAGPLHRLWGARGNLAGRSWPSQADVDSTLKLVHEGGTYFVDLGVLLRNPGMEIDLEPILPGVLVDRCLDSLLQLGYMNQLVEVAGTWRATGLDSRGRGWQVPVTHPLTEAVLGSVELKEAALALAAPAQQTVELGGRATSSMLDPRDGKPLTDSVAAWVLAEHAEDARVWALALAVLGADEGIALLDSLDGVEGALVSQAEGSPAWHATSGFPLARPADALLAGKAR